MTVRDESGPGKVAGTLTLAEIPAALTLRDLISPFAEDSRLSEILSKAFLLAADAKSKDPTITRQISRQIARRG